MQIKIEKNIYVRDKYKVKRQAFTAGQLVDQFEYDAVLSTNSVINPQDLPKRPTATKRSLATKDLAVEPVETVVRSEDSVKEAEAEVVEETKPLAKEVASSVAEVVEKPKAKQKAKAKDE